MKKTALIAFALTCLNSSFAATPVKIFTQVEYLNEKSGEMRTYSSTEEFVLKHLSVQSYKNFRNSINFTVNDHRRDGRPVMMKLSNVSAWANGVNVPDLDLRFSFPKKKLETGRVYRCTQNYYGSDECRIQLFGAIIDLGIPNEPTDCSMTISTSVSLDFNHPESSSLSVMVFPSVTDSPALDGTPFAMAFDCVGRESQKHLIRGHFLFNTDRVPTLE